MGKLEQILKCTHWGYYDLVDVLSELYYDSIYTKSMVDKKIPSLINIGIRSKKITDGVEGDDVYEMTPEGPDKYFDIDYNATNLNIRQVIEFLKMCDEKEVLIAPDVLKTHFLSMKKPKARKQKATNSDPEVKAKMKSLNELSRENREEAKKKIADYIIAEMSPPCTCLSSQMKKHVINSAKAGNTSYSLTFLTKDCEKREISDKVLTEIISSVFTQQGAKERIHKTTRKVSRCDKHGLK